MEPPIVLDVPETIGSDWIAAAVARLGDAGGAIVIRGLDRVFCVGLPLERAATDCGPWGPAAVRALRCFLNRLRHEHRPILCLVGGEAKGAGVGLAAVADVVVAHPAATFQLPEVIFGLIPSVVLPVLAARVGWPIAKRMALGSEPLTSSEALRCGLVDRISSRLDSDMATHLDRWRKAHPDAIAAVRRLVAQGWPPKRAQRVFEELWSCHAQRRISRFIDGGSPWSLE